MIQIKKTPGQLLVEGHAGFAERGKDVVCAGVSALVCTLAENLRRAGGQAALSPGRAELRWQEGTEAEETVEAFGLGLGQLAVAYPECIRLLW